MVSVRKSPNMMSTTGRRPVIAAPTPIPVKPASEIGVSSTRSAPNSSTSPESTLNGVPASATSSPKMHTLESRRISSASASRTAWANVNSRSGIDVLVHLIDAGIRRGYSELDGGFHLSARFRRDLLESGSVGVPLFDQPLTLQLDRISIRFPALLFGFGAVIFAIDIANVVPAVAIRVRLEKGRPFSRARSLHEARSDLVYGAHILAVDDRSLNAECRRATKDRSRGGLGVMRVLVIEIVFANVDDGQLPELRQVHDFIERSLAERAFTEEAHCNAPVAQPLSSESRAGSDSHAAADNRVGA